jgi:3-methyladenine DNA glycosylase AlkC
MQSIPNLDGLSWPSIRALARDLASAAPAADVVNVALAQLDAPGEAHHMLATWLLGFTCGACPANLDVLRERVAPDSSWQAQEALAQAFDAYCAAVGYEAALPIIDAWLADAHPNVRRAVSEGLRPWTARSRRYFAVHPGEAIRRLASLRADPSDYVRHSVGNALRDIRRAHSALVDAETATWNPADPREAFTYARVLKRR